MMSEWTVSGWILRIGLILFLLIIGVIYGRGWSALQNQAEKHPHMWQIYTFVAGLAMIGLALISSLEALVGVYFSVRVVQHILLTAVVPLLLLVSNPYPTLVAGLPPWMRRRGRHFWETHTTVRQLIVMCTTPGLIWALFVANFWLWHDAYLIEAARTYAWVHLIEVLSMLLTACFYWWHIAAAEPYLHRPMSTGLRMGYAFIGVLPIKIMGMVLLFGTETVGGSQYVVHDADEMVTFLGVRLADKSLGAMLIWVLGGVTYTYAATFLAGRWMETEEEKPPLPLSVLEDDETWVVPGMRK